MEFVRGISEKALGILYPPRCPICDEITDTGGRICPACTGKVREIGEPVCKKCGKPLEDERREYCPDCAAKKHLYTQGKAVFVYGEGIPKSLYRFKYANKREYAEYYADRAAKRYGAWLKSREAEVLVPVPMYFWKKRLRGYNQAEIFARALGRNTGIPVDTRLVKRVRNTAPQKTLNDVQRKRNLKNAFQLVPDIVEYTQIVLVDDIYTTGSTMDAVAGVLLDAGVKNIYYICISIGTGY